MGECTTLSVGMWAKRWEMKKGMIEIVTCRCCGRGHERVYEGNVSGPGCKCSGFWCVISAKCVAHCPGLLAADHACSSADAGSYARTFLHDYRTDVQAGEKDKTE